MNTKGAGGFKDNPTHINRKGRPKSGAALTDFLNFELDKKNDDKILHRQLVAKKIIELAESGNIAALKYIFNRIDGMPRQAIEISSDKINDIPTDYEELKKYEEELDKKLLELSARETSGKSND
jgi:hypothetical protein